MRRLLSATLAGSLTTAALAAQEPAPSPPVPAVPCRGQRISDVNIHTRPPYYGRKLPWWQGPLRTALSLHHTTDESVVRRFMLLHPGTLCDEARRAESERILRAMPFIAAASVRAVADSAGGVAIEVETVDELTTIVGARVRGGSPFLTSLRAGDGNVGGTGTYVSAEWKDGNVRDTWAARVIDYQFGGRPYLLDLRAARRDVGQHDYGLDLSHPFLTDQQRVAWVGSLAQSKERFNFFRGSPAPVPLSLSRRFFDAGAVVRIGEPGRLSLFGVSFSREEDAASMPPLPDTTVDYAALLSPYARRSNARINALWALRNVDYRRVARFDALTGEQDVKVGFQLGTLFGRGLSVLGTTDDDILVAVDAYGGLGGQTAFMSLSARAEGRQNYDVNQWNGILGGARLLAYARASRDHTLRAEAEWDGGWRQQIPFQLTLGDPVGGIRGFRRSHEAGGRRAVLRLEDRWYQGELLGQADLGLSFFVDAGKLKAGDVPYGVTTPLRASVGLGLLAAVPPGSKRTYRLDIAIPVTSGQGRRVEFRLSTTNVTRGEWREPDDIRRSRERAVPVEVFGRP